jgi:hypothetical protein
MNCGGIMHTDVRGLSHTDAIGEIPVGPVRLFGIAKPLLALGDIHAGVQFTD